MWTERSLDKKAVRVGTITVIDLNTLVPKKKLIVKQYSLEQQTISKYP